MAVKVNGGGAVAVRGNMSVFYDGSSSKIFETQYNVL
jgi:hypothetical protein